MLILVSTKNFMPNSFHRKIGEQTPLTPSFSPVGRGEGEGAIEIYL